MSVHGWKSQVSEKIRIFVNIDIVGKPVEVCGDYDNASFKLFDDFFLHRRDSILVVVSLTFVSPAASCTTSLAILSTSSLRFETSNAPFSPYSFDRGFERSFVSRLVACATTCSSPGGRD
ncbi:hypothetical protein ACFE04_000622 [Oxalis oulophora]